MYGPLTTIDKLKRWLGTPVSSTADDGLLEDLIATTSDLIGRYCARDNLGEVLPYQENYWRPSGSINTQSSINPKIVLQHWPVVAIASASFGNAAPLTVLTNPAQSANASGIFLNADGRTLSLLYLGWPPSNQPLQINYTAGYNAAAPLNGGGIPNGLIHTCNQFCGEIYKSKDWIGYRSKTLAGETVTYDTGNNWGMSPRTVAMLQPYRNRIPFQGLQ